MERNESINELVEEIESRIATMGQLIREGALESVQERLQRLEERELFLAAREESFQYPVKELRLKDETIAELSRKVFELRCENRRLEKALEALKPE